MRRALLLAGLFALLTAVSAATPPTADAAAAPRHVWEQGTNGHPFILAAPLSDAIEIAGTSGNQSLELKRKTLVTIDPFAPAWDDWPFPKSEPNRVLPDPRMAFPLQNGHVLVCCGKNVTAPRVMELDAAGDVVWQYGNVTDERLVKPFSVEPSRFGGVRCLLISDRGDKTAPSRVFAVTWDDAKEAVWQYGGTSAGSPDHISDAFCATQIPPKDGQEDGDVLIADSNGGNRVIEVHSDAYDPARPDHGWSGGGIVWQYGVTGHPGTDPGYLEQARSPQLLRGGKYVLIADAVSRRVIVVKYKKYDPSKPNNGWDGRSIVWSYQGGVDGDLGEPNTARLVPTGPLAGTVLISDSMPPDPAHPELGQKVMAVSYDKAKRVVWELNTATWDRPSYITSSSDASSPRDARIGPDGALWIADADFGRVIKVGNEGSGTVVSQPSGCGYPNMVKAFDRIKIERPALPAGTGIVVWYSTDGGDFSQATVSSDGLNINLKAGVSGKTFAYKVKLKSDDKLATPVLEGLTVHFSKATTGKDPVGGGGPRGGTDGNSGQSGTYTYPSTAQGGTGTSGTGTGSGASGAGSGSGTFGAGTGSAAAGAGSSAAAASLDVPVQSTGAGPTQQVQGYPVQGVEGVSGVPLRAAEGPQAPEPERPGPPVPWVALVAAAVVVAGAFFIPWPFVSADLRSITGFDHTRPARFLPFRPLGK